ncbi:uncharacterized protein LOC144543492 [Centroberyx gerrardi]
MASCGNLLKSALVVVVLVALAGSGSAAVAEKLASCCEKVTNQEIKDPILGYLIQQRKLPCVLAVIFQTEKGLFCSQFNAPWVRRKIVDFETARRTATSSSTPSTLLSLITSTASPPS